jgi:hypothetical protein
MRNSEVQTDMLHLRFLHGPVLGSARYMKWMRLGRGLVALAPARARANIPRKTGLDLLEGPYPKEPLYVTMVRGGCAWHPRARVVVPFRLAFLRRVCYLVPKSELDFGKVESPGTPPKISLSVLFLDSAHYFRC